MGKSKRTKALEIPIEEKYKVAERDSQDGRPCCIWCGTAAPGYIDWSCCHVVPRSQGGMGIAQNIVTLCPTCHTKFDQSTERSEMRIVIENYLKGKYKYWTRRKCIYNK